MQSKSTLRFLIVCLLWYMSSAITNNIGKEILGEFRYPVTLTLIQFGFVAVFGYIYGKLFSKIEPLDSYVFHTTIPLSLFQIFGHIFSSLALTYVPVSFSHTIKALSPMFTVLIYRLFFRVIHSRNVYLSLVILTVGVMLVCATNLKYHPVGFLCALISTIIFVIQNIFSKKLFNEARYRTASTRKKLDKLNLLFYSGTFAFVLMFPLWIYYDGLQLSNSLEDLNVHLVFLFVLNGVTHFSQAMLAFSILSLVSPITYSIASLCKRIFVITASILYFRDQVSFPQGLGILLTFFGLYQYHLAEQEVEKSEELVMEIHRKHSQS